MSPVRLLFSDVQISKYLRDNNTTPPRARPIQCFGFTARASRGDYYTSFVLNVHHFFQLCPLSRSSWILFHLSMSMDA